MSTKTGVQYALRGIPTEVDQALRKKALGAGASQVRNMVVRQGMSLALVGLSRLIESFLFGVKGRDPVVFTIVPAVLGAVALPAVWLPASRASRLNPVDCLRHE